MLAKGFVLALLGATALATPLISRDGDMSIVDVKRGDFSPTLADAVAIEKKRDGSSSGGPTIADSSVVETTHAAPKPPIVVDDSVIETKRNGTKPPIVADGGVVEVGSGHGTSRSPIGPATKGIETRGDDGVPRVPIIADDGVTEMVKI